MEVSKTNNRNDLIDVQRKINYNEQAIVKYAICERTKTNSSKVVRIRLEDSMKPINDSSQAMKSNR